MLKQIEEIGKSRNVERINKKIVTYSFNLSTNEYYCPNCMKIFQGSLPDWCGSCGCHWDKFLTHINNPIEVDELQEISL